MKQATVSADGDAITIHVRMAFRKRGGRKLVFIPDGAPWAPRPRVDKAMVKAPARAFRWRKLVVAPDGAEWGPRPRVDNAMVKALAQAFRWRKMLDTGVHATLEDLARAKGVAPSYVSRILRLTLLAPDIVEAILDGRQPAELQLDDLLNGFPLEWKGQIERIRLIA